MQLSLAQEKTVTGTVTDGKIPLSGANVKNGSRGVQTDTDGKFAIKAAVGDKLTVSFKGFETQSINVGSSNNYNVKMNSSTEILTDVLIVGKMGIKRTKNEITSPQTIIGNSELTQAAAPTVVSGLIGKISGLEIKTTSNSVDSGQRIVIGGPRTVTGNNQALVIIDNVNSTAAILNSLPPEVVENVTVLKGAQGAALYGEQGVNGVIMVTTKKGSSSNKMAIDFNTSVDIQKIAYLPERQTRYGQGWFGEHISIENGGWGAELDGSSVPVGLPQADGNFIMAPYSPIKDNIGKFFNTGTIYQNTVSVLAGSLKDGYANLTIGRQDREFVVKGDELKRTSFSLKAGKQINKWFVEGNAQYFNTIQRNTSANLYSELLQTATNIPVEQFENSGNNSHWNVYYRNPYWTRENNRANTNTDVMFGSVNLKYDINKNIDVSWDGNVQLTSLNGINYLNAFTSADDVYNSYSNRIVISNFLDRSVRRTDLFSNLMMNFDYKLTDKITFKANLGNNIQDRNIRNNQIGGNELDVPGFYSFSNVLQPFLASQLNNTRARDRRFAFFGNFDFGYDDYLFLNITGRNDWTSVFNKNNRSFFYPSVGLAFVPTKMLGITDNDRFFNYAKVALGWTRVGNSSAVSAYDTDETGVIPIGYPYGDLSAYGFNASPTDINIKPEFVTSKDISLALGFFRNRLTLEGQYYIQTTTDLITRSSTSSASGLNFATSNAGDLTSKGYNIDLGATPIKGRGFQWDTKLNYTHYKTVIDKLAEGANEVNLGLNTQQTAGIFAVVGEEFPLIKGVGYLRDPNGNVIINADTGNPLKTSEFVKLGKSNPDYIIGFSNSVSYKGLKFSAVCDYRTGHQIYSEVMYQLAWSGHLIESSENGRTGGFIFPNSVVESAPGVYTANSNVVTGGSSYASYQTYFSEEYANTAENLIIDATAFKVRELSLSYSLPKRFVDKTGLNAFTIGVNARNPFMVLPNQNRNYADPEASNNIGPFGNGQGIANVGQYPNSRTFGFTLNAKF